MNTSDSRRALQAQIFPEGIPRLWCPTHFHAAREPDAERIRAHLAVLAPRVHGILVPGSTGEGWEMSDEDIRRLLGMVLDAAREQGIRVLIGVLKTSVEEMFAGLDAMEGFRAHPAVAGLTICPPKGSELKQSKICDGLRQVLSQGWPTALYQLPQVTGNEMSPETVAVLAGEFPNFILFKDTSGTDHVAKSRLDLGGVFMVRGAEVGGYARWLRGAGGAYDGFLLASANVFHAAHAETIRQIDAGSLPAAEAGAAKIEEVVREAFAIVQGFPAGNAFSNATKSLDHCMAHGADAVHVEAPLLYSGVRLPVEFIERAAELLQRHHLLPQRGYLHHP